MARALELVGADSVIFEHPECRAKGHNRCHFRARWGKTKQNTLDKPAKM
jgi:predicted hydrocarbon binding protein